MTDPLPPMAPVQNRYGPPTPWYRRVEWVVFVIVVTVSAVADRLNLGWVTSAVAAAVVCLAYEGVRRALRRRWSGAA